jgi:hypothetical protein
MGGEFWVDAKWRDGLMDSLKEANTEREVERAVIA